jgi:hypothetical protein
MNQARTPADVSPLATAYLLVGLTAVGTLGVLLVQNGGRWGLMPSLIGAAGLAFRWRSTALIVLAGIALGHLSPFGSIELPWLVVPEMFPVHAAASANVATNLAISAATLVYLVAQYRLLGLSGGLFPARSKRDDNPPRAGTAGSAEVGTALFTAAAASVGAFLLWRLVGNLPAPWGIVPTQWRLGVLAWLLIGGLALTAAVLAHLGWRRLSRAEAAIYLQDALWHETRGDQRRINRWRAWCLRRR